MSVIYQLNSLDKSKLDIKMFLWYVWEDFYQNKTSPKDTVSVKVEDFRLTKEDVAELPTSVKMDGADPMLNILSWFLYSQLLLRKLDTLNMRSTSVHLA